MLKKAFFGAKMVVFGPKILTFTGGSKGFGTHKRKRKCAILTQKFDTWGQKSFFLIVIKREGIKWCLGRTPVLSPPKLFAFKKEKLPVLFLGTDEEPETLLIFVFF